MKPIETWVVLANTRDVRILANRGPGKGLVPLDGKTWQADVTEPPRDKAGVGHSIAGPGVSAVDPGDPHDHDNQQFAHDIAQHLSKELQAKKFDRLVFVAGPQMLGLLRAAANDGVKAVVTEEIAKDLSTQSKASIEAHLGEVIAI